jgi:hypothetical protein
MAAAGSLARKPLKSLVFRTYSLSPLGVSSRSLEIAEES